jgi:CelD/BcsL family acetyltransferase involved in cellulose biosynthesis
MEIDVIDDRHSFDNLKANWDEVYNNDNKATIFQSWAWLRGWVETISSPWLIICVRSKSSSSYVGFFPLILQAMKKNRVTTFKTLTFWGNPSAEHTGVVCIPEFFDSVSKKVSQFIQNRMKWHRIQISDALDPRIEDFVAFFDKKRFAIQELEPTLCPYIALPESWERFLMKNLTGNSRKNIRKALNKAHGLKEFHMTTLEDNDFTSQIESVRQLWEKKWGEPKHNKNKFLNVYRRCFDDKRLIVNVFWIGTNPIAGLTAFVDHKKKHFVAYSTGFDPNFSSLSPGTAIIAHSIDYAIQNGFLEYDLGRGDEKYKYTIFGAENRFNRNYVIDRISIGEKLIPQTKIVKNMIRKIINRSG